VNRLLDFKVGEAFCTIPTVSFRVPTVRSEVPTVCMLCFPTVSVPALPRDRSLRQNSVWTLPLALTKLRRDTLHLSCVIHDFLSIVVGCTVAHFVGLADLRFRSS
jgi:hypothetical protein